MGAMGERFLILEETADALDVIDPELAMQFRSVNGLPRPQSATPDRPTAPGVGAVVLDPPSAPGAHHEIRMHEIRMDVRDDRIRADCTCGGWTCVVGWDDMDDMVAGIRQHVGGGQAYSEDGIAPPEPAAAPLAFEKRVG